MIQDCVRPSDGTFKPVTFLGFLYGMYPVYSLLSSSGLTLYTVPIRHDYIHVLTLIPVHIYMYTNTGVCVCV